MPSPINNGRPRILVAPLDWGLGHATRCIPLIQELLTQGADVWLAGEGTQEALLREEFPQLPFLPLPGYRVRYARTGTGLAWQLLRQLPRLRQAIRNEHRWLKTMVLKHGFQGVISDNRYGLHHRNVPCFLLTHQLRIQSPLGAWSERLLQRTHYRLLRPFTACWVPDTPGEDNLAGALAHPTRLPSIPVHYIGWLSRFTAKSMPVEKDRLLVILSGPEPQRSIWENRLLEQLAAYPHPVTLVRGLPGHQRLIPSTSTLECHNHLDTSALGDAWQRAGFVLCRSGYSSLMDATRLGRPCIVVPTPGQTEQEYLARYGMERKRVLAFDQRSFSLQDALQQARVFPFESAVGSETQLLHKTIGRFLSSLRSA
ncbi:MAG: hypothetical protein RJA57_1308 [Bacteroidota bacterium]|jgi:hypothetical protein